MILSDARRPGSHRVALHRADKLTPAENGDLVLTFGRKSFASPDRYCIKPCAAAERNFRRLPPWDARTVKFWVGDYDRCCAVIIDPIVSYSTYFNGAGDDQLSLIAVGVGGVICFSPAKRCRSAD